MDRPTIFLSSTIYDFRDLRSALKSYLEEKGCRVLASEANDFLKAVDLHSYDACLETIGQADIFILLIGTRVGGWYDEPNRVSITQQEYRRAYDLAKAGKLRILTFVRSEVWLHRQSTKELERHLDSIAEIDAALRARVSKYPTAFAEDATFIHSFIGEVSRNKETAEAAQGKGTMPVANWVHNFSSFSEITDAIGPLVTNGLAVKDAAGRAVLLNQILALLQNVMSTGNSGLLAPFAAIRNLATVINLGTRNITGNVKLDENTWNSLVVLGMYAHHAKPITEPLAATLNSELLLEYRPQTGTFHPTEAYDVLTDLVDQTRKLEQIIRSDDWLKLLSYGQTGKNPADKSVVAPTHLVAAELHLLFRWADTIMLAKALALYLDGKPLVRDKPMPISPFLDQEAGIVNEQVTLAQVRAFVGLNS